MKDKLFFFPLILILFISCDILRVSPFEVISWTPLKGYHSDPENVVVSLNFSLDPDRASIERNFSLTGNGNRVRGTFFWHGRKMTFAPLTPLEKNNDYIVSLSADAHDRAGLSMDEDFYHTFTTRAENERPALLSCYPEMFARVCDPRAEIHLTFSNSVPLKTLYDNVSFNPSMTGSWRLEDDGKSAVFTPSEPWMQQNRYEIRCSSSLTDNYGRNTGKDFLSVFTAGTDSETPYLLHAQRKTKHGNLFELIPGSYVGPAEIHAENDGWEKEDKLILVFSKPVDSLSVKNNFSAENAPGLVMETSPGFYAEFVFRFENIPVYDSRFTFRVKPGVKDGAGNESKDEHIYRIYANGIYSKPPVLAGLRMPMAPGSTHENELFYAGTDSLYIKIPISAENYPSGENIQTWIELYFLTAEGASVDPFSLMELFRLDTSNNVISFSPRQVKTSGFSVNEPHKGWENYQRIEITGNIINSINFGIINFQIGSGLKDNLGNKNDKSQRISLVK